MNNNELTNLLGGWFHAIIDFMHIELHWCGINFTLWEGLTASVVVGVVGYLVGGMLHKDD